MYCILSPRKTKHILFLVFFRAFFPETTKGSPREPTSASPDLPTDLPQVRPLGGGRRPSVRAVSVRAAALGAGAPGGGEGREECEGRKVGDKEKVRLLRDAFGGIQAAKRCYRRSSGRKRAWQDRRLERNSWTVIYLYILIRLFFNLAAR